MVLYDFKCPACQKVEEVIVANPDVRPTCEDGHAPRKMERLPSAPGGFKFRGDGFHVNDYGKRA